MAESPIIHPAERPEKRVVLIVEDDKVLCEVLKETLQVLGYRAYAASDGAEALKMVVATKVKRMDLVISDLVMPGMNALELYEALKESSPYDGKMLIVTGYPMPQTGATLASRPGVRWAKKPIRLEDLESLVGQMILE